MKGIVISTKFGSNHYKIGHICPYCRRHSEILFHNSRDRIRFVCYDCASETEFVIKPPCCEHKS